MVAGLAVDAREGLRGRFIYPDPRLRTGYPEKATYQDTFKNLHMTQLAVRRRHARSLCPLDRVPGKRNLQIAGLLAVTVLALSACGGGGGGGSSSDATAPTMAPPVESAPAAPPPVETPQQQAPVVVAPPPLPPLPPPPSLPPLPPPPQTQCIQTDDKGCLEITDFNDEVASRIPDYEDQRNFKNQWGLASIKAQRAYAQLELIKGFPIEPGEGVTLGFIDTGIDQGHQLFAGSTIHETFLLGASNETGTRFSHGTAVASVAAAPRIINTTNAGHGVAWGADIAMFTITAGRGPAVYNPVTPSGLQSREASWITIISSALNWRSGTRAVDFLNLSVGTPGIIDNYSETDLRTNFGGAITEMAQQGATDKTILVWAAGNAHGDQCTAGTDNCVNAAIDAVSVEVYPGLVARIAELQGHTVAVTAIGEDGLITDFSNRCGIAANWCLAAPGEDVLVAHFGPHMGQDGFQGLATVDGTSFAAPMVSGGLAVMKQLFRDELSNTALLARLLETANDSGVYASRSVYGHGLMDLGAATSPVGVLEVVQQNSVGMPGTLLQTTLLQYGPAFGDGLTQSFSGREFAAFDALGAPFWFDLGDFATAVSGPSMGAQLQDFLTPPSVLPSQPGQGFDFIFDGVSSTLASGASPWKLGLMEMPGAGQAGHFALAEHALGLNLSMQYGLSATAFTSEGISGQTPATGALLSWRAGDAPWALQAGWFTEHETLLGSQAEGAFGDLASDAVFFGVEADWGLAGWRLGAMAEVGSVRPVSARGLITEVSPLATSTFAVRARRALGDAGTLRISVSQPLRIERGQASLTVPIGRTKAGDILRHSMSASLVPSGRQLDVAAHWFQPLGLGEWRVGTTWSHEPEHRASADAEFTLLTGWLHTF